VFFLILAIYPAILFRTFFDGIVPFNATLFCSNVFSNESGDFSKSCLDVLFTSLGLILPMFRIIDLGLKVLWLLFF